jgi:hypothetical protein
MKFLRKPFLFLKKEKHAGGMVYVPPAACLPSAHTSAHVPACVKRTGRAGSKEMDGVRTVRPVPENSLILVLELNP